MSQFLYTVFSCATVVVVMAWASPTSIFGFGGAQEGPFSAALENVYFRRCPTKQVFAPRAPGQGHARPRGGPDVKDQRDTGRHVHDMTAQW